MREIAWEKIFSYYNSIKKIYIECEETDPELKTNLQPLNEFRAALDHLMRLVGIEKFNEYKDEDAESQSEKLLSHLRRAFYDICDMLSINYRNKIVDALKKYSPNVIKDALPDYYSKMRPDIEEMSETISSLRTNKGFNKSDEEQHIESYLEIIRRLKAYYKDILRAMPSLEELHNKENESSKNDKKKSFWTQYVIPICGVGIAVVGIVVGVIVGICT